MLDSRNRICQERSAADNADYKTPITSWVRPRDTVQMGEVQLELDEQVGFIVYWPPVVSGTYKKARFLMDREELVQAIRTGQIVIRMNDGWRLSR